MLTGTHLFLFVNVSSRCVWDDLDHCKWNNSCPVSSDTHPTFTSFGFLGRQTSEWCWHLTLCHIVAPKSCHSPSCSPVSWVKVAIWIRAKTKWEMQERLRWNYSLRMLYSPPLWVLSVLDNFEPVDSGDIWLLWLAYFTQYKVFKTDCVVAYVRSSFVFLSNNSPWCYNTFYLFIHESVCQFAALNDAMCIHVKSFCVNLPNFGHSLGCVSRSGIGRCMVTVCLAFQRAAKLFFTVAVVCYNSTNNVWGF